MADIKEDDFNRAFSDWLSTKNRVPMTASQIARAVGCSTQQIYNIQNKALAKVSMVIDRSWLE